MTAQPESCWWLPEPDDKVECRLFCFPCAGAEPSMFRVWPELPENVSRICAQLAGRAARRRTAPFTSIPEIVEDLAAQIAPLLDRPFVFLGHSMGGWVAYELARLLQSRGMPLPQHMVLSGSLPIVLNRLPPFVHRMSSEALARELRVLGGTPETILADPRMLAIYQPAIQADFQAFETHVHKHRQALPVDVSLWAALDDPRVPVETMPLWRDLFSGQVRENLFEGGHMFILDPRNREKTAALVRRIFTEITVTT